MFVKSISVANFKSFKNLDLKALGRFNILIGGNASGKTNFIQAFRFLRDIAGHGLRNAVSMQGGADFLRNTNLPPTEPFSLRISYDPDLTLTRKKNGRTFTMKSVKATYEFGFFFPENETLRVTHDRLSKQFDLFDSATPDPAAHRGTGRSLLSNTEGTIQFDLQLPPGTPLTDGDFFPIFLREEKIAADALLIETPLFGFVHRLDKVFDKVAIYDFDPRLPKHSVPITGKTDLEEDGGNLAICLKTIIDHPEQRRKFTNLIKDLLPFIEDITVEKVDKSLFFKLKDRYSGGSYVPSSFISDGTLNILAMIVALYFEKKPLMIIEEPERNIHPQLISKMVSMMKEVSCSKQILLTTHHPDIVRLADLEHVWFSSRDPEGFSTISRPIDNEETRVFLEKQLGIEDLFKQDLLGL